MTRGTDIDAASLTDGVGHPRRRTLRLGLAVCALPLLMSCTAQAVAQGPEPELPERVPVVVTADDLEPLPLMEYRPSVEEELLLTRAHDRLVTECGARFGVTVVPPERTRADIVAELDPSSRYGLAGPTPVGDETRNDDAPLDPRQEEDMTGASADGSRSTLEDAAGHPVPEFGCGREAWDRLGYVPEDLVLVDSLMNESVAAVHADSRFLAVDEQWSACMSAHGISASSRLDDLDDDPHARAVDRQCGTETNWTGVYHALDVAYQKELVQKNAKDLAAVREHNDDMVRRARALP